MHRFWYEETHRDPEVSAHALALAGVLTAAETDLSDVEGQFRNLVQSASNDVLRWRPPLSSVESVSINVSEADLASVWKKVLGDTAGTGGRQLLIDLSFDPRWLRTRKGAVQILEIVSILSGPTLKRAVEPSSLEPHEIASVAVAAFDESQPSDWSWPLNVDVGPVRAEITLFSELQAVQRGLVNVVRHIRSESGRTDIDLLIDVNSDRPRVAMRKPANITIVQMDIAKSDLGSERVLQYALRRKLKAPYALLDMDEQELKEFLNTFIYDLSHNDTPDRAIFYAYACARRKLSVREKLVPPIILAPLKEYAATMDYARLQTRVAEVIQRLKDLPGNMEIGRPDSHAVHSLGIDSSALTAGDWHIGLDQALQDGRVRFDHENDAGEALPEMTKKIDEAISHLAISEPDRLTLIPGVVAYDRMLNPRPSSDKQAPPPPPIEPPDSSPETEREQERYIDLTIFSGHLYEVDDRQDDKRLEDDVPLPLHGDCTLEVAIRQVRVGIDADAFPDRRVKPQRNDKETVKIYARVRALDPEIINFKDSFLSFDWDYDSDSERVFFRFSTEGATKEDATTEIEVRLYTAAVDLLEIVEIQNVVIGSDTAYPAPRTLVWPASDPSELLKPKDGAAPVFTIHVYASGLGYTFEIIFGNESAPTLKVPTDHIISITDLKTILGNVRDYWRRLAINTLSSRIAVTDAAYSKIIGEMVDLGKRAWYVLFGDRFRAEPGTAEALGDLISGLTTQDGAIIQISYETGIGGFVFPWALLYPPSAYESDETQKPEAFWGLGYKIEQLREPGRSSNLEDEPIKLAVIIDPSFPGSTDHACMLAEMGEKQKPCVDVMEPISQRDPVLESLTAEKASHLYYFFCHGYAPGANPVMARDSVDRIRAEIDKHDANSPDRELWETFADLLLGTGDEAKIFLGNAELTESELRDVKFFNCRRPIVFLNMCQSADLLPGMNSGLARLFIERGAAAVIGTECPMTSVFAGKFGEEVVNRLLSGENVGEAIWQARRRFHKERNPLGFAYTLYGHADARLGKPK